MRSTGKEGISLRTENSQTNLPGVKILVFFLQMIWSLSKTDVVFSDIL